MNYLNHLVGVLNTRVLLTFSGSFCCWFDSPVVCCCCPCCLALCLWRSGSTSALDWHRLGGGLRCRLLVHGRRFLPRAEEGSPNKDLGFGLEAAEGDGDGFLGVHWFGVTGCSCRLCRRWFSWDAVELNDEIQKPEKHQQNRRDRKVT